MRITTRNTKTISDEKIGFANPRSYESALKNPRMARLCRRASSGRRWQPAKADLNLHAYVGADPMNWTDPDGLAKNEIVITAPPRPQNPNEGIRTGSWGAFGSAGGANSEGSGRNPARSCTGDNCVEVTGPKPSPQPALPPIIPAAAEASGPNENACSTAVHQLAGSDIFSRYGITGTPLGLPPYGLQGKTVLSTMYGDNKVAVTYFIFLHKAVDDWLIVPNPLVGSSLMSVPSRISYRIGASGLARIDIPADTFTLSRPESIHVSPQCPTKK
jgi:hypothetical protein